MALLRLEQVSKTYLRGRHEIVVLDGVSFEVGRAEFIAIFGQRASGKTTLLRLACGIEAPDSGSVWFNGCDLSSLRRPLRIAGVPRQIGWVRRAGPSLPNMVMINFVALPLFGGKHHRDAQRRAAQAMREVGVPDLAWATWGDLSDAERTLVTIAQAIVHEPLLLLADDPTVSLTLDERETVLAVLRKTADRAGTAVLMTVPDVPDMLRSHTLMSLSDGELIGPRRRTGDVIPFPTSQGDCG